MQKVAIGTIGIVNFQVIKCLQSKFDGLEEGEPPLVSIPENVIKGRFLHQVE